MNYKSGEIITLQFGNFSNYVGTHWWNIQESNFSYDPSTPSEINHDVLFREGENHRKQTTFTPRMLLMDQRGSITQFKREGELYNEPQTEQIVDTWDQIETIKEEEIPKKEFLKDLDDPNADIEEKEYDFVNSVEEWNDFSYTRYHPRTINILPAPFVHEKTETLFDNFALGQETWKEQEEFEDKIRNYIEECDGCQGFQVLLDIEDAFSGLATKCIEEIRDQYGKSCLAVPLFSPKSRKFKNSDDQMSKSIRLMNIALAYDSLSEHSSMFIPVSTMQRAWRDLENPRVFGTGIDSYVGDNFYHSSAIVATFLDTISLRYRLKNPATTSHLTGFCSDLTGYGRKMTSGALGIVAMNDEEDFIDALDRVNLPLFETISPNSKVGTDYIIQSLCIRGIPENRLKKPREKADKKTMQMAAYGCRSVSEMLQLYYQCAFHRSMTHVTSIESGMELKKPFPREIFNKSLNEKGFVYSLLPQERLKPITSVPVLAAVQNSTDLGDTIEGLLKDIERIKFPKIHRFRESNMEQEEYQEAIERLRDFKDVYDDGIQL